MLNKFIEVNDSLDRNLANGLLYLIGNRFSEADIILFSYLKVVKSYKEFDSIQTSLSQFGNLNTFFANLDEKYSSFLREKLKI